MASLNGSAAVVVVGFIVSLACAPAEVQTVADRPNEVALSQLWQEPADLEQRNLFYGPGGLELLPESSERFEFVAEDRSGYSPGFDVRDMEGVAWSVKLGPEAQSEVALSRLLWAIGYYQPPIYYLARWTMTGRGVSEELPGGRFRPGLSTWKVVDDWSWYDNEFVNTPPFRGLVVANVMFNNWDWKTSNNKVYEVDDNRDADVKTIYVVRDLGASLGKTSFPGWLNWFPARGLGQGSRNDIDDFESQGFIKGVDGDRVQFHYRGIHAKLLETISSSDVVWTCRLMSRLSDAQWHDAFRAAGYSDDHARRYIAKLKSKIAEGLKLADS